MAYLSGSLSNTKSLSLQWLHVLNFMNIASLIWSCSKSLKDYNFLGDNVHPLNLRVLMHALLISFKLRPQPSYGYTKQLSWIHDSSEKFAYSAFSIRQRMRAGNCLIFRGYLQWHTAQMLFGKLTIIHKCLTASYTICMGL